MANPISAQLCWTNSFIGMDSIWPLPPVGTMNLVRTGFCLLNPASLISLRAASMS
ncbi:MAG: hypothetical protein WDN49_03760 [Acetobacteraceae bacterium]